MLARLSKLSLIAAAVVVLGGCSSSAATDTGEDGSTPGTGPDGGDVTDGSVTTAPDTGVDAGPPAPTHTDGKTNGDETDVDCGGTAPKCADTKACKVAKDCTSSVCTNGVCQVPTNSDGAENGDETDIDCGGANAPKCADTKSCVVDGDCKSVSCINTVCQVSTHDDGVQNGDETDIDCGGLIAPPCPPNEACKIPADCTAGVCTGFLCQPPRSNDGVQNGDETDVDCGGLSTFAPKCIPLKACKVKGDCDSGVCTTLVCQAPTKTDGVQNGDETDVHCGGTSTGAPACAPTKACKVKGDCTSGVCTGLVCQSPSKSDGVKNGNETDVDCGGTSTGAPKCTPNEGCKVAADCDSGVCGGLLLCNSPAGNDGVKNGDESDSDCGGTTTGAPRCNTGKVCVVHADCASDGCDYNHKCALRRSCTAHFGGDTCGQGGEGGVGAANWESCCATAPAGAGGVAMDKYKITSGRMRAFLERVNGDVRTAIRTARAAGKVPAIPGDAAHTVLDPAWDLLLPTSMGGCDQNGTCGTHPDGAGGFDTEVTDHFFNDTTQINGIYTAAYRHIGGSIWASQNQTQQGCSIVSPGTHSYWMSPAIQSQYFGDIAADYDQDVYDTKGLNCVPYLMSQAFCVWDGGRLETMAEWTAAIGPDAYPWGPGPDAKGQGSAVFYSSRFPDASDASLGLPASISIEYGNFNYSYEYPHQAANGDYIVFINAPGRLKGYGPWGHADLAYMMFENTSDVTWAADGRSATSSWAQSGSWEGHGYAKGSPFAGQYLLDKYGKMSGRCVYP